MNINKLYLSIYIFLFIVFISGCGGRETPQGPLGAEIDMSSSLPAGIRAPDEKNLRNHQKDFSPGDSKARVRIAWQSFEQRGGQYIHSVKFEVVEAADGVEIRAGMFGEPVIRGSNAHAVQSAGIEIAWYRKSLLSGKGGQVRMEISADGRSNP